MLKITCEGVYYKNGGFVPAKDGPAAGLPAPEKAREGTMAHAILKTHNTGDNMEAVSYTHLDVYKRQPFDSSELARSIRLSNTL